MLTENYACCIVLRNMDGIMPKHYGAWHPQTHNAFQDYYNLIDNKLKQEHSRSMSFINRNQRNRWYTSVMFDAQLAEQKSKQAEQELLLRIMS